MRLEYYTLNTGEVVSYSDLLKIKNPVVMATHIAIKTRDVFGDVILLSPLYGGHTHSGKTFEEAEAKLIKALKGLDM